MKVRKPLSHLQIKPNTGRLIKQVCDPLKEIDLANIVLFPFISSTTLIL